MTAPRNFCVTCGNDFASLEAFDKHRVGEYTDIGPDTRLCLDVEELTDIGLVPNDKGRFHDPARSAGMAERFERAA